MPEADPWLLKLKQWKDINLLSEIKYQEVAHKVKRGVKNVTIVFADKSKVSGGEGSATQIHR
jgi:hypothetical protein